MTKTPPLLSGEAAPIGRILPPTRPPMRLSIGELAKLELPDIPFIVPGLLPIGLSLLGAKPKIGKSWLALNLTLEKAAGGTFLGIPLEPGGVLYAALEDNHRRLQDRLHQLRPDGNLPENVDFWLEASEIGPKLIDDLQDWIRDTLNPSLVIIDTKGRLMPARATGQDDYTFTTRTLGALQHFALTNEIAILLIHHTRKSAGENADPFDQILGSTGINGVMDAVLILERARHQPTAILSVTGRDIEEREVQLTLDEATGTWRAHTHNPVADLHTSAPEQLQVLKAISGGHDTPTAIGTAIGKNRTTVQNHLKRLQERSLVENPAYGKWVLTELAQEHLQDSGDSTDSGDSPSLETVLDSSRYAQELN